jgi:RimJ/RimL family protein N-acetyltransferase
MLHDDIRVRRVGPGDAQQIESFYADLSAESRFLRFHGATPGIRHQQAEMFAAADHEQRDGFVAVADGRIVGHLVLEPLGNGIEELAVAVDDRIQHRGVGTLLLAAAIASARLRHIRRLVAWVMVDNIAMGRLLAAGHYPMHLDWDGSVARYELDIPADLPRSVAA